MQLPYVKVSINSIQINSPEAIRLLFPDHIFNEHGNRIHIYADWSKMQKGVGYANIASQLIKQVNIIPEASIFTTELRASLDAM